MSDDFRQRWGLPEEDFDKRFQKAIYRILVVTGNRIKVYSSELKELAFIVGVPVSAYGGA